MNIKILVACHKQDAVFSNEIYTPIQVGTARSNVDLGYLKDNTGDNISEKNPHYCELTAQYWAWKNLKNVDIIGLCHYRRYFQTEITQEGAERIFSNYDVILAKPEGIRSTPLYYKLRTHVLCEDALIFFKAIDTLYPEYGQTVVEYMFGLRDIPFNMFVMKNEFFQDFAKWQFDILSECEKYIHYSPFPQSRRIMGYLGEYLLPIYCLHNHLRIKHMSITPMLGVPQKQMDISTKLVRLVKKSFWQMLNNLSSTPRELRDLYDTEIMKAMVREGFYNR
jgi:hypothetical protein